MQIRRENQMSMKAKLRSRLESSNHMNNINYLPFALSDSVSNLSKRKMGSIESIAKKVSGKKKKEEKQRETKKRHFTDDT